MGYGYGSGKRSRGRRRARRTAGIAAAVVGLLWFLLGYGPFEQIGPVSQQRLLVQIGAFLVIGLGLIVGVWVIVRLIGPFFFRKRGVEMTARKTRPPAAEPDDGETG